MGIAVRLLEPQQSAWLGSAEIMANHPKAIVGLVILCRPIGEIDFWKRANAAVFASMRRRPAETERAIIVVLIETLEYPIRDSYLPPVGHRELTHVGNACT